MILKLPKRIANIEQVLLFFRIEIIFNYIKIDLPDEKVQCLENPSKISGKSGFSHTLHVKGHVRTSMEDKPPSDIH